jgi:hypothetical protein
MNRLFPRLYVPRVPWCFMACCATLFLDSVRVAKRLAEFLVLALQGMRLALELDRVRSPNMARNHCLPPHLTTAEHINPTDLPTSMGLNRRNLRYDAQSVSECVSGWVIECVSASLQPISLPQFPRRRCHCSRGGDAKGKTPRGEGNTTGRTEGIPMKWQGKGQEKTPPPSSLKSAHCVPLVIALSEPIVPRRLEAPFQADRSK